ncbi:MAG: LytR/AlgR family response regulator transcription factor [Cyclobacteriaceae bacterium]
MKVLIVEDEALARERLHTLLKQYDQSIEVVNCLDSVEETVEILSKQTQIDLLFLDIQLSDGTSFEVFKKINVNHPVIFTTAYDKFALQAFKLNSIDYLLKPIDFVELTGAINKYKKIHWDKQSSLSANPDLIQQLLQRVNQPNNYHKKRFIVKFGDHIQFKQVEDVGYFFADGKTVYLVLKENNRKYIIDHTLEELENKLLDPGKFFRINRKFILSIDAIKEVNPYFNSRLKVHLNKGSEQDLIVSRERVNEFKLWLNL